MKKTIITFAAAIALTISSVTGPVWSNDGNSIFNGATITAYAASTVPTPTVKQNNQKATISWNKVANATKYCIYMQEDGQSYQLLASVKGNTFSTTTGTLKVGKKYFVRMCAYVKENGKGYWTSYSDKLTFTVTATTPSVPSISSVAASSYSAVVKWNKVSGVSGYYLDIWKKNKWVKLGEAASNATSYEITGLTSNSVNYVRIRSFVTNSNGTRTYSSYSPYKTFYTKKYLSLKTTTTKATVGSITKGVSGGSYDKNQAYDVASLINQERSTQKLGTLVWDETLYRCAQIRAREIAVTYSHYRPNGTICGSISSIYKGENIVYGYHTAIGAHQSWMGSASHKENILRPSFKKVAVACYKYNGTCYWVTAYGY